VPGIYNLSDTRIDLAVEGCGMVIIIPTSIILVVLLILLHGIGGGLRRWCFNAQPENTTRNKPHSNKISHLKKKSKMDSMK